MWIRLKWCVEIIVSGSGLGCCGVWRLVCLDEECGLG